MNETMTALVITDFDEFEITRVPIPAPGAGEILVKVEAAGLCHTDLDILAGRYSAQFPRIPGHEFAGIVVDVRDPSMSDRVGTRVSVDPLIACRTCRNCVRAYPNLCTRGRAYGAERDGGFAQYAVVRAENAHYAGSLPAHVAALAEPFACAVNALQRAAMPRESRVAIIGAGPMGMILTIALRGFGIDDITLADRMLDRLECATRFGATDTALVDGPIVDHLPADSFDLVIDATGRPTVVQEAVQLLADAGTIMPFGVCPPGSTFTLDPFEVYRRQLRIIGSFSLNGGIPEALSILSDSAYPVGDLVTTRFSLAEGADALAAIGGAKTVKIQFDPTL